MPFRRCFCSSGFKRAYVCLRSGKFQQATGIAHQTAVGRTVSENDYGRANDSVRQQRANRHEFDQFFQIEE